MGATLSLCKMPKTIGSDLFLMAVIFSFFSFYLFYNQKISDSGLIKWDEGLDKGTFLEYLTARGNISYVPPEMFNMSPQPPEAAFDVYRYVVCIVKY